MFICWMNIIARIVVDLEKKEKTLLQILSIDCSFHCTIKAKEKKKESQKQQNGGINDQVRVKKQLRNRETIERDIQY